MKLEEYIKRIEIIKNDIIGCDNLMEFYRKCPFIGFSRGQATDIKKGYICDKYEEKEV